MKVDVGSQSVIVTTVQRLVALLNDIQKRRLEFLAFVSGTKEDVL